LDYKVEKSIKGFIIKEKNSKYEIDLRKRLIKFSVDIIKFLMTFPNRKELDVFKYQLSRSATSVGANFEEAQSTSFKEFVQKMRISLREANETRYWLQILGELNIGNPNKRTELLNESKEIALIFGSIVSKADRKIKQNKK
jgi:four helix bundle protein